MISSQLLKICVVGNDGVGKSSLTLQFTQAHFPADFDPTVEDVYNRDVELSDGSVYSFQVLDTALQDEYSPLKDQQFSEADGFMLLYSVGDIDSFASVTNYYRHITRVRSSTPPPMILVGTQADHDTYRVVTKNEGEQMSAELDIHSFGECSAKLNLGVTDVFTQLAQSIIKKRLEAKAKAPEELKNPVAISKNNPFTTGSSLSQPEELVPVTSSQIKKPLSARPSRAYNREASQTAEKSSCCCIM